MKARLTIVTIALLLITMADSAWAAAHKLSDQELDQVTGGDFTVQALNGAWQFAFNTAGGVNGNGTLSMSAIPLSIAANSLTLNQSSLSLNGNAQQNLQALVNVNAVNSTVNVLLNLNINMPNSVVGTLTQGNQILHR